MTPKEEWENVIIPQFDKATQEKLQAWRKRSKNHGKLYSYLGVAFIGSGTFIIGYTVGICHGIC